MSSKVFAPFVFDESRNSARVGRIAECLADFCNMIRCLRVYQFRLKTIHKGGICFGLYTPGIAGLAIAILPDT